VAGSIVANYLQHPPPTPPTHDRRLVQKDVAIERPLLPSEMTTHADIVRASGNGWTVRGTGEGRYSYLARWPDAIIDEPQWLVVKGVLRRGGLTIGLLKNERWALVRNVTTAGPFGLVIPVREQGRYAPLVANCLPKNSLENDFDITSFGWASAHVGER